MFKSTDGCPNWTAVNNGLAATGVLDLVIDPKKPANLYAAIYNAGLFKITHRGDSWTPICNGLASLDVRSLKFTNPRA